MNKSPQSISTLARGQWARVVGLEPQTRFGARADDVTQRLKELGFLPGARLRVVGYGLFGQDPIAVQVNGTKFALRRIEASHILVEPEAAGADSLPPASHRSGGL